MRYTKENFPEITSTHSKHWTSFIKGLGMFFSALVPVATIILAFAAVSSEALPVIAKIFLIILAISVLCFFGWLIRAMLKTPKAKITHITIGKNGIRHYAGGELVQSLSYDELLPNPDQGKHDVFLHYPYDNDDFSMELFIYGLNRTSNTPERSIVSLDAQYVITNGNLLKRHFIKGIMIFRPDLKIAPYVINLYGLKEH